MKTGIYLITNTNNGKKYVGSAINLSKRWNNHRNDLRQGVHHNRHLQNAWNKYSESSFSFSILEFTSNDDLITREQYYIDLLDATNPNFGYNINPIAGSSLGVLQSEETKEKIRAARIGKKHRPESIEKIRQASLGSKNGFFNKIHSIETKTKISNKKKGTKVSEKTKLLMSDSHKGKKFTQEHKFKIAEANSKRIVSEETKQKMSEARKGKKYKKEI